jgi:hypothetical protein
MRAEEKKDALASEALADALGSYNSLGGELFLRAIF